MLGIHTAIAGGILAFVANVDDIVWNNMYANISPIPIPKDIPIPFFLFFADNETPIAVIMNAANAEAPRFQYSTSNS